MTKSLPLKLSALIFDNMEIKKGNSMKCLGILMEA